MVYIERRQNGEVKLRSVSALSLTIFENTAVFAARATLNGAANHSFRATVVDNGDIGNTDQFGLNATNPGGAVIPDLII